MENKNYDLKLAGYIWSILKTQPIIVMSWGVDMDTIKPVEGGLEFHVQGFKHTGMVQIILDEGKDLFEIHLIPDSEGERKIIEDDYLSKITTVRKVHYVTKDPYQQLFLGQDILRPSCGNNCKYRNMKRPGDLTIADCRGLTKIFPDLRGSKKNYSTIISNTKKGEKVIVSLHKTMNMRQYSLDSVVKYNPLFAHQTWISTNRDAFMHDVVKNPIETINKNTQPLIEKKINISTIVKTYLPSWLIKILYKIQLRLH